MNSVRFDTGRGGLELIPRYSRDIRCSYHCFLNKPSGPSIAALDGADFVGENRSGQ